MVRFPIDSPPWRWALRLALALLLTIGWWVAVAPSTATGDWFAQADKLRHLAAFAGFAVLMVGADLRPRWVWALGLVAYGMAIEWAQSQVPGRQASGADVVANAAGVLLGWWVAHQILDLQGRGGLDRPRADLSSKSSKRVKAD